MIPNEPHNTAKPSGATQATFDGPGGGAGGLTGTTGAVPRGESAPPALSGDGWRDIASAQRELPRRRQEARDALSALTEAAKERTRDQGAMLREDLDKADPEELAALETLFNERHAELDHDEKRGR